MPAAVAADTLADTFGVCVHTGWFDTIYGDLARLTEAFSDLGVRHVRDDRTVGSTGNAALQRDHVLALHEATGARWDFLTGSPTSANSAAQYVADLSANLTDAIELIEGTNEWDLTGRPGWVAEVRARQQALWTAAKADSRLHTIPVIAPSVDSSNTGALGDISAWDDVCNGHCYFNAAPPSAVQTTLRNAVRAVEGPAKPVMFTETGYHNAINRTTGWHQPTSEAAVAVYQPRIILENALRGITRSYSYELLDHAPNPARDDSELNFGLIRNDWTRKPSFTAMQNMLALVSDPDATFTPQPLEYAVAGDTRGDLRQYLTQRSDGRWLLFLWRDVSVWNVPTRTPIVVAPYTVTLTLPETMTAAGYQPTTSAAPVWESTSSTLQFAMAAEVLAVVVSPTILSQLDAMDANGVGNLGEP